MLNYALADDSRVGGRTPRWREVDWSAHVAARSIGGRRVRYVSLGAGEPACVLIHGLASSWQWWLETMPELAAERRVVALDLPGFGGSDLPAKPLSARVAVEAVEALADALGLERFVAIGHSMGTLVALRVAIELRDRVSALVLAGGPILSVVKLFRSPLRTIAAEPSVSSFLVEAATAGLPLPAAVRREIARRPRLRRMLLGSYANRADRLRTDLVHELLQGVGAPGVLPALRNGFGYDAYAGLESLACPVLVVHGAHDRLVPSSDVADFARRVPQAQVRVLPEAAHWPMLEQPDEFNHVVREFLAAEVRL
jgi:pimeloyl-ACP methyl ester carboxylesterase